MKTFKKFVTEGHNKRHLNDMGAGFHYMDLESVLRKEGVKGISGVGTIKTKRTTSGATGSFYVISNVDGGFAVNKVELKKDEGTVSGSISPMPEEEFDTAKEALNYLKRNTKTWSTL